MRDRRGERPLPRANAGFADGQQRQLTDSTGTYRPGERMSPILSLYLDLTRAAVALIVLLSHCWLVLFPNYPLHWPGPAAVIVFFVLSGFVIAYVTDGHDRTLGQYALNRLARLWSVALPALAFGLLVSHFVDTRSSRQSRRSLYEWAK
jgi:peptidoglycan/LPS O-acetylase OafA/YrhL